jgi:hypothetical protein
MKIDSIITGNFQVEDGINDDGISITIVFKKTEIVLSEDEKQELLTKIINALGESHGS